MCKQITRWRVWVVITHCIINSKKPRRAALTVGSVRTRKDTARQGVCCLADGQSAPPIVPAAPRGVNANPYLRPVLRSRLLWSSFSALLCAACSSAAVSDGSMVPPHRRHRGRDARIHSLCDTIRLSPHSRHFAQSLIRPILLPQPGDKCTCVNAIQKCRYFPASCRVFHFSIATAGGAQPVAGH